MTARPVPGAGRVHTERSSAPPTTITRSEEALETKRVTRRAGAVRVRKRVDERPVEQVVPIDAEHVHVERTETDDGDSGLVETLPDGSISIPVFEERLVVEKKLVVRERIIVRKVSVTEDRRIDVTLRRERVEIDPDPAVADLVREQQPRPPSGGATTASATPEGRRRKQSPSTPPPRSGKEAAPKKASARAKPRGRA